MDPLDHLGGQDGGELVGDPGGQLTPRVRVGHIAQCAGAPTQGRDQEPCQGGDNQSEGELRQESPVRWDTPLMNPFWFG